MNEDLIKRLKGLAVSEAWCDDAEFMVDDYAGGNMDDAYQGGQDDGMIMLAREILDKLNIEWVKL